MVHRFQSFEIDEPARELRAGSRILPLQPLVFELLLYLAKNRGRVVPKDELLDTLWPDATVAEGSLQRAVSLARAALAEAGAPDAIRTHARLGYRFCDRDAKRTHASPTEAPVDASTLDRARAACESQSWTEAVSAFETVDRIEGLGADDLQRWALAAQHAGRSRDAIAPLERAVAAYRKSGDRARAAWVAIHLAQLRMEWREPIPANGWYQTAIRLLKNEPPCREKGYLSLIGCRVALYQNNIDKALEMAEEAREAGERFSDPDLESLGLVYIGTTRLLLGRVREGVAAIDEAGASVTSCGLSSWAGGLVYCGVIYSCLTQADWQRAGHWADEFTRWGEGKGVTAYPGLCQMHRAQLVFMRGELQQAEQDIRGVCEMLGRDAPWAEGEAWRVLGEILAAKGEYDEAYRAYGRATELGWDAQYGLAMLRYAQGDAQGAATLLGRIINENAWSYRSQRGWALAHYCMVAAAAGQVELARATLADLERDPGLASTAALQALASQARGELAAAEGRRSEGLGQLRSALRAWIEMDASLMAAETRCRIATLLAEEGDEESASLERAAAAAIFRRSGAKGMLDGVGIK